MLKFTDEFFLCTVYYIAKDLNSNRGSNPAKMTVVYAEQTELLVAVNGFQSEHTKRKINELKIARISDVFLFL